MEEDELWGVIDDKGNIIIPIEYYGIEYDDVGVYVVDYENDKCGLLNELGERITTAVFDDVDDFIDGLAPACVNGKYGFIDKSGQTIIDYQFDKAECFSDGYAAVKLDGKYGYINKDGRAITGYKFDDVRDFNKGTAVVKINGRYWLLGASGELLTRRPYFDIGYENSTAFYNHLIPEYSNKYQDLMYDYVFNGMII